MLLSSRRRHLKHMDVCIHMHALEKPLVALCAYQIRENSGVILVAK